jgi:GNAT superfamily N-acetyltransferase
MSTPQRAAASLMEYEIRAAALEDAPFCADAWRAMMEELEMAPDGFVPDWRERLTAHFAAGIRDGSQGWFVAAAAGGPAVGSAAAFLARTLTAEIQYLRRATIAGVYVAPEHRRAGLARELVTRTIQWARERGCRTVCLQASPLGERLYRSLGFEDGGELILKIGS